ncbi:hypothetical protein HG535_0C06310 [Zygotorulaspora mrakii]|uniref:Amino acid permease/ SLC12A domain-containing protein n=1 Tax=Zygotorulaspora mrakii TaxID=42260 RepID=A0A7H9B1I2_ZYGMR|nr:uncharacterized protein HG535_0C06310 [Zygotorulaspora mrakii]QLG72276.1 hypothetical protein HG535_0C06310 [Zygotorulaspora mrakii]
MSVDKNTPSIKSISITATNEKADKPALLKNFKWLSLFGIAFSLTNSWLGVSSSLVVGLSSGGPVLIVYGLIVAVFFAFMCGYSLSEFASVLPSSSGSSFWVLKLMEDADENETEGSQDQIYSDDKDQVLKLYNENTVQSVSSVSQARVSLTVGLINYFGSIFTTSSICSSLGYSVLGAYSLYHVDYEPKNWHVFVIYEVFNIIMCVMNSWGKILPFISQAGLYCSLLTYCLTFIITLACRSSQSQPWPAAESIFKDFNNTTGWSSSGISFIVGLVNPLWAFAGIDSATHMVDEVGHVAALSLVPKAIMATIFVGFITSFSYAIAMFFCITDSDRVVGSILPIIEIYYQATENRALAVFLQSCCILTGTLCGVASGTWQSRILWSIGRDYSVIIEKFSDKEEPSLVQRLFNLFAFIHPCLRVPIWSMLISHFFVAAIGCVIIGSTTAFNAIISACICLLLLSYAIPTLILLIKGKRRFYQKVSNQLDLPFTRRLRCSILSYIPNLLTICWTIFSFIFFSFPYELPVSSSNMNYVSAAYGGVALVVCSVVIWAF